MRLYRFAHKDYVSDLTGTGGLYYSGRWHEKGTRIVYFSENVALAKLEVLANTHFLPKTYCLLTAEVPDDAGVFAIDESVLPANWDSVPPDGNISAFTENWIADGQHLLMRVPSVHSPVEYNYLFNPLHPQADLLKVIGIEPHDFDRRYKIGGEDVSTILRRALKK